MYRKSSYSTIYVLLTVVIIPFSAGLLWSNWRRMCILGYSLCNVSCHWHARIVLMYTATQKALRVSKNLLTLLSANLYCTKLWSYDTYFLLTITAVLNGAWKGRVEFDESGGKGYSKLQLFQFRNGKLHGKLPVGWESWLYSAFEVLNVSLATRSIYTLKLFGEHKFTPKTVC